MKIQLKSRGNIFLMVVVAVCVISVFASSQNNVQSDLGKIPITYLRATYAIDYSNLNEVVGDADYVFVGTVKKEETTVYKNVVSIENENGKIMEESSPYTNYKIDVLENIKGNLATEGEISIQKSGGISKDKTKYIVFEGDELPKVGKNYIFFAYAQPDGSLLLSGKVSNIDLKVDENADYENSTEYREVLKAYENQELSDRQRYTSEYDL